MGSYGYIITDKPFKKTSFKYHFLHYVDGAKVFDDKYLIDKPNMDIDVIYKFVHST